MPDLPTTVPATPAVAGTTVAAVVVTWNRRELLQESLAALRAQTHPPKAIVVVDNASTDGTAELLDSAYGEGLDVIHLTANTGGAGGFAAGIERALGHRPDLIWLLDDDTVPTPTAAAELVAAWNGYPGQRPTVLASKVVWTDGRDHPMNTPRHKPFARAAEKAAAAEVGAFPVRSASFVSIMCDAAQIADRGLPIADYFLWNDDFEYSTRLIRGRVGLSVPASVVVHKTSIFGSTDVDPGERFYFEVRNKVWLFSRSNCLSVTERVLYGGATLRRWLRTFRISSDRRTLRRSGWRGLVAGFRRPRANADVLAPARPHPGTPAEPEPFALLISTYGRDDPDFLREAFDSATVRQTRPPAEVVLVQDGPVPDELAAAIQDLVTNSEIPVTHLPLVDNIGLGPALDAGLEASSHEIVARMDADDVCRPDRFALQIPLIEGGADIVGSGLTEFGESIEEVVGSRTPPVDPAEIRRVIKFRDPFNHPTVVYRRSAVLGSGGYTHMPLLEDYLLFTRMVEGGAVPANLAEPLVYYRVGAGAYARRGGRELLRSEIRLQRRFRQLAITTRTEFVRNVVVRGVYRLIPEGVRKVAYRRLLANRSGTPRG